MKPKKISKEQYIKEFCRDRRIRDRRVVYVTDSTHQKLKRAAALLHDEHQTAASLADAILDHHLKTYQPIFDILQEESRLAFKAFIERIRANKAEEEYDDETADEE